MYNNPKRRTNWLFLISLFVLYTSYAQERNLVSLEEARTKARANNADSKLFQKKYEVAKANYEQTRAVLLPQIRLTNTSTFTNNPLMAFGFKLLQRDVTAPDFDPGILNDPGDVENFNTRIEVQQPLINVDGWKERKAANLQVEISNLHQERYLEYLDLEVTKTYMQLQLSYRAISALEKARETAVENERTAKNHLDQGLIQPADHLNVQVRLGEVDNQLVAARSQAENVSEYLSVLIGNGANSYLTPVSELLPVEMKTANGIKLNTERKDIRANAMAAEAQKNMYSSSKLSFVPRANAMASYGWNDAEVFGFGASNYVVGLQLSWDLFNGYQNIGKIHKEKALLEQAELAQKKYLDQSELELNKAIRQRSESQSRMVLASQAVQQSAEALRVITNRFEQGLEKTRDLLHAESQFLEKELTYYESVFNLNYAQVYIEYLSK